MLMTKLNPAPVTFCCLNVGNYCGQGAAYVNRLYAAIRRNLPLGLIAAFVCFTDDATGLDAGIEARALPDAGIAGWWNKLSLFKPGVFAPGTRLWYFDLDTLVAGPLDDLVHYDGEFALLRDFYWKDMGAPGICSWRVSASTESIWREWDAAGRPTPKDQLGDLWWINCLDQGRFTHRADKLQDLFPGKIVSYQVDCRAGLPEGTSVVCFHGQPKNHNVGGWAQRLWEGHDLPEKTTVPA